MKKLILCSFVFVLGFVFALAAEDLGGVAKREKARREELAKSGKKVTTLTNDDIENLKSTSTYEFTGESTDADGTSSGEEQTDQTSADESTEGDSEAPSSADIDKQIEDLKQEKEQAEEEANAARETVGQGGLFHSHNAGNQYQTEREAKKKSEELDQEIKETEAEKEKQKQEPE